MSKKKIVVLAIFKDKTSADTAAASLKESGVARDLKDSGIANGDVIRALVLKDEEEGKGEKVGERSISKGAAIGCSPGSGSTSAPLSAGLQSPLRHKPMATGKEGPSLRPRLGRELAGGKAAVAVLAPASEAEFVAAKIRDLGAAELYTVRGLQDLQWLDRRCFFIKVAWSAEVIESMDAPLSNSLRRYQLVSRITVSGSIASISLLYLTLFYGLIYEARNPSTTVTAIISYGLMIIFLISLWIVRKSSPQALTYSRLVDSIYALNKAAEDGSAAASRKRQDLGKRLLKCAATMRTFRPLLPLRLHKRIMSQEAIRGSQALKTLVYPAMLGSDKELQQIKELVARAAIRVGTENWVQVGDLKAEVEDYSHSKSIPVSILSNATIVALLTFAAAVITIIPPLIVFFSHPSPS
jgi:hypothetical protein